MSIVTLDLAKAQLSIAVDYLDDDDELQSYCDGITDVIEDYKGEVIEERAVTEEIELSNASQFSLSSTPVVSLTSVVGIDTSTTWDVSALHVSASGRVRVLSGAPVTGLVEVTYQAGYATIPERYVRGALVVIQHVWETRRGIAGVQAGVLGPEEHYDPRYAYAIPRKALEWLGAPIPGVA